MRRMMMASAGAAPPAGYYGAVATDNPVFWWRHGEPSGTVMEAEAGSDGVYTASTELAQPALYAGGPTCFWARSNRFGQRVVTAPALNSLTVECIAKFVSSLSGFKGLVSSDNGSVRKWQQRMSGNKFEFVKIAGGVGTVTSVSSLVIDTSYHLVCTVSATGLIKLYINGVLDATGGPAGAANYGGSSDIQIGYMSGGGGASANAYFSESAIYDQELSAARVMAHAVAAGLA